MKNYKSILIAIIYFSFTLFSCSDILQEKTEQKSDSKTYLMVRAGGVSLNSRSIDPSEEYALANSRTSICMEQNQVKAKGLWLAAPVVLEILRIFIIH